MSSPIFILQYPGRVELSLGSFFITIEFISITFSVVLPSLVIFTIKSIELSTFNILLKGILWFVISEILFISKKYCLGVFNCSWPDRTSFRFSVKITICFNEYLIFSLLKLK